MKRFLFCLFSLLAGISLLHAQSETPADSIALPAGPEDASPLPATVKNYGGFLLDMNILNPNMPERPSLNNYKLTIPYAGKDYSALFRPQTGTIYTQSTQWMLSPHYGIWSTPTTLQMHSFQLNNGWRLNTYGEYNADGWRMPNPSALPWERNNFKGAFELKSDDGSFGFRIEVEHGQRTPFY